MWKATVLAFGHPVLGKARPTLLQAAPWLHGVIKSDNTPFRCFSSTVGGPFTQDRLSGVAVRLGRSRALIPVFC